MMKRFLAVLIMVIMFAFVCVGSFAAEWNGYGKDETHNAVTDALTPVSPAGENEKVLAMLKWAYPLKSSDDWGTNVSDLAVWDGYIYIAVGNTLLKLSASGTLVQSAQLHYAIDYTSRLLVAENRIIVPEGNGVLEAFDADLNALWHTQPLAETPMGAHQTLTTVTFADGLLYYGTAVADWVTSYSGAFICVNAETGATVWRYDNPTAGYYWSGAVIVNGSAITVGDDGLLTAFDSLTGAFRAQTQLSAGVRSTICACGQNLYITSTDGVLHKVSVLSDGTFSEAQGVNFAAFSTVTPTCAGGYVFVGGSGGSYDQGVFAVIDAQTLAVCKTVAVSGDIKSAPLVSTINADIYVYFTVNNIPGAVYTVSSKDHFDTVRTVYTPAAENQNYCMSSVAADAKGNLYYTNDSGRLFCIKSMTVGDLTADARITLSDVILLARAVLEETPAPDITEDGKVGLADVITLAKYILYC